MRPYDPLSQRDPRWAGLQLGTKPLTAGGTTVGAAGCFLTVAAMIARHYGHQDVDPAWINARASFVNGNLWADGDLSRLFPEIVEQWRGNYVNTPADLSKLAMADDEERLVVIHRPALGFDVHALRAFSWDGHTLVVDDPWWGDRVNFASRYGADLAVAITAIVGYQVPGFVPPWKQPRPAPGPDAAQLVAELASVTGERDQARKQLAADEALLTAAGLVLRELTGRAPAK